MRLPFRNHARFAGWVGNDPERRIIAGGVAVVSLRICAKDQVRGGDGKWQTIDEWATAVFYRHHADDVVERGVKKGAFIDVEGKWHTRRWTGSDGHQRSVNELLVNTWHLVAVRPNDARDGELATPEPPAEPPSAQDDSYRNSFKALA